MTTPRLSFTKTNYLQVAASTVDDSASVVLPNGETHAVHRFRANGADPEAYVALIWDYQGASETIVSSTKGDIDSFFDILNPDMQFIGDGVKKLSIVIINDNTSQTPIIGGSFELVRV